MQHQPGTAFVFDAKLPNRFVQFIVDKKDIASGNSEQVNCKQLKQIRFTDTLNHSQILRSAIAQLQLSIQALKI